MKYVVCVIKINFNNLNVTANYVLKI